MKLASFGMGTKSAKNLTHSALLEPTATLEPELYVPFMLPREALHFHHTTLSLEKSNGHKGARNLSAHDLRIFLK